MNWVWMMVYLQSILFQTFRRGSLRGFTPSLFRTPYSLRFTIISLVFLSVPFLSPIARAQTVTYHYDEATSTFGVGRLTSVNDSSGTTKFFL